MAKRRFINPNNVMHGLVAVETVQSVTLNKTKQRIVARGDNDVAPSSQFKTGLEVSGTLVIQDPIQADALFDAPAATLTWDGVPEAGGQAKRHTVVNVEFFNLNETDQHGAVDGITLGWNSFNPDGSDPHSSALVAP
jgi:hypothetical protein